MGISRRGVIGSGLAAGVFAPMVRRAHAAGDTGTLRAVMQGDLRSFDPIWTTANISAYYGAMVYDTLFAVDDKFKAQPQMVDKWSLSDDKKTYTFQLRDGLGWQDNTPVTAADCVASIRRWAVRNSGGQAIMARAAGPLGQGRQDHRADAEGAVRHGDRRLRRPARRPLCFMMPKKDAETDPFQQVTGRIGSGPFTFNQNSDPARQQIRLRQVGQIRAAQEPPSGLAGGKVVNLKQVIWDNIADEQTAQRGADHRARSISTNCRRSICCRNCRAIRTSS